MKLLLIFLLVLAIIFYAWIKAKKVMKRPKISMEEDMIRGLCPVIFQSQK